MYDDIKEFFPSSCVFILYIILCASWGWRNEMSLVYLNVYGLPALRSCIVSSFSDVQSCGFKCSSDCTLLHRSLSSGCQFEINITYGNYILLCWVYTLVNFIFKYILYMLLQYIVCYYSILTDLEEKDGRGKLPSRITPGNVWSPARITVTSLNTTRKMFSGKWSDGSAYWISTYNLVKRNGMEYTCT